MVDAGIDTDSTHPKRARRGAGGPAASGGFNYQAAVTGISMAHALAGASLGWLDELLFDAPVEVAAETGGGGDDLSLTFAGGEIAEAQIKKGLRAGRELSEALAALVEGLATRSCDYALLVVDPGSSGTIRQGLAADLRRLADAPTANVGRLAQAFRARLSADGLDTQSICRRLRIVTVAAVDAADAAIRTAIAHLGRVCQQSGDALAAWDRLYRDAHVMMARRSRRTRSSMSAVLRSADIGLSADPVRGPAAVLTKICDWTIATTAEFTILGVPKALSIDDAWLDMSAQVRDPQKSQAPSNLEAALAEYHRQSNRGGRSDDGCDATTLGRFRRLAVVRSGPGSGKTTLLKKLARTYARDGFPVLRVTAKSVARRMAVAGEGFLTAAFSLGLEGSGISPEVAQAAHFDNWVLLCDGLDECGSQQDEIGDGLLQAAAGAPGMRIIATTRAIGYRPAKLAAWRHYDLPFGGGRDPEQKMTSLLTHILSEDAQKHLYRRVTDALEDSDAGKTVTRSPLMVGLCAALFARGSPLGRTRVQFYRAVFDLLEREPPPRAPAPPASAAVRSRFLDVLGWTLTCHPQIVSSDAIGACAQVLQHELVIPALKAHDLAASILEYWQALGVVEQLYYGDVQVLAFVHKTFGEFAAGRHLSSLPLAEQEQVFKTESDASAMSEVIAFASGLGVGPVFVDDLIRRGFDGTKGQGRLLQAIETLGHARPPLDANRIEQVVEVALARISGSHRTWALETADALAGVAKDAAAQLDARLTPLCSHEQMWTRLAAWTLRVETEGDKLKLDVAIEALHSFPKLRLDDVMSDIEGRLVIGRRTARDLVQRMALTIAERLMTELSAGEVEAELERFASLMNVGSMGFHMALAALVEKYDVKIPSSSWARDHVGFAEAFKGTMEQRGAINALLETIQDGEGEVRPVPATRPLYTLAAFLDLIGLYSQVMSEVWVWRHPFDRTSAGAVFRAYAAEAGLPHDELASEAAALRQDIAAAETPDLDALSLLFRRAPSVDVAPPDLQRRLKSNISFDEIERTLYHLSALAVVPALNLALAVGTTQDFRRATKRLLTNGKHESLWAAGHLAAQLPREESAELLLAHLASPALPGSDYLLKALETMEIADHPSRQAALMSVLLGKRVDAAISAADWVLNMPSADNVGEGVLLRRAFDHWVTAEEPYPKNGGTIPPSPRAKLASALYARGDVDFPTLIAWTDDSRSDVAEVARQSLINLFTREPAARSDFIELVFGTKISSTTLRTVLEKSEPFAPAESQRLLDLLDSADAKTRYLAMTLLDRPDLASEQRQSLLARLREDPISEIRERAIRMSA